MASIRRTDIMHNKGFSRGRPAKSERERNRRRQEAYRWRDARRIYLASSFDRWRKLRCSLGMKDSVLAWHLMEAHEKGQCGICKRDMDEDDAETTLESQTFLPLLVKAVTNICHSQFQFDECIKVVGLLCLEFDNARKENFSLDETILAKVRTLKTDHSFTVPSHTNNIQSSSRGIEISNEESTKLTSEIHVLTVVNENIKEMPSGFESEQAYKRKKIKTEELEIPLPDDIDHRLQEPNMERPLNPSTHVSESGKSHKDENMTTLVESGSYVESEADVSLEIDVERIDTSQDAEQYDGDQHVAQPFANKASYEALEYPPRAPHTPLINLPFEVKNAEKSPVSTETTLPNVEPLTAVTEQYKDPSVPLSTELPLDMSLEKPDLHSQRREDDIQKMNTSHSADFSKELSVDTSYPELTVKEFDEASFTDQHQIQAKRASSTVPQSSCRPKEEIHPSIPWQRRDMSRKEEYEFLELNPFSDLSEFSQRYPHVHQRTYYRWKRRIKEEYIILEQCPHMSFDQFSSVVLQAKESVFNLWKSFIAQGKGFFAPSDASKRLEAKCPTSKAVNTLSDQYSFLQKNLSCTQEQFCQKFLNTSEEVFIALKRKVLQEFWVFYHNQHLDWKEFTKLVDISEEVHNSWRDHVSKDVKSTMSCFSPNAQMVSPHYPPFQNACDPQAQLLKANFPTIDSTLEDSVSRSLSASYLNSVQNMMFPWASYYGVHAPLNQQMLPMMLWPRMMGLNAGTPNPMNLPAIMASSPSSCGSKSESPHDRTTLTSQSILQPQISLPDTKNVKTEKMKVYSQTKDAEEDGLHGVKRSSSLVINENDSINESDCHKKQRLREEVENMNAHSPVSKSRKQNKQEYIYYLKNPSLNFKDLESLFPTISLRTFYRWRKEMNAALLFIQGKKDADYQQFKLVFPDIPEDVFEIWGAKSCKENFGEKIALPENGHRHEEKFEHPARNDEVKEFPVCLKRNEMSHQMDHHSDKFNNSKDFAILGESSPAKKQFKAAHVFIHQNPNVDFASFSQKFPNISARSFYRWKKEWKDAIEILQANPGIDYERYKSIDSSVTEEIFEAWKQFLYDARTLAKDSINYGGPSVESKVNTNRDEYTVRKLSSREFAYLQLHPKIEFHQFKDIFPYVANDTFCQWKKEIDKIINYVRSQPSVSFEEISAVLPDVSEDAFLRWKELIAFERQNVRSAEEVKVIHAYKSGSDIKRGDSHHGNPTLQNDNEEAKTKMTNALLHLMHNPNIEYQVFSQLFPFVSTETFELWLHRIKAVILHISSNPSLDFEEFRSAITDIGEDIFEKWKALTPEQISAIGNQSFETPITEVTNNSLKDSKRNRALYFCKENPDVTYDVFSTHYFNISETDFKCWMLKISTQISFIRDNKNMTFEDFSGIYPDVEKAIFDSWKTSLSKAETMPHFLEPSPDDNSASVERSNNVSDRVTNGQVDPSMSEMYDIEGSGLLKSEINSVDNAVSQMNFTDDTGIKDQDSSLRKLAKLTESNASYYRGWNPRGVVDIPSGKDYVHTNGVSDQSPNPSTDYGYDCSENNNNTDSNDFVSGYPDHYQTNDSASVALQRSVMSPPLSDGLLSKVDSGVEQYDSISLNQENQSLSALMVMSADRHKFPSVSSTPKMEQNSECISQSFPNQGKWKYDSTATSTKDEEEMFSSQRQKKMSRAEYLFVKDNPDVDSQEFARIFPGVSARTFYRWKKEIKAQMQIA